MSQSSIDSGPGARTIRRWFRRATLALAALVVWAGPAPATPDDAPSSPANQPQAATPIVPASRAARNVAILTVKGPITAVTTRSLERRIEAAERGGADAIVFDIDTPGGEVGAVLQICSRIKRSSVSRTVAWINPTAYSGGAIIALACDAIVVAPQATFGDAAPIAINPFTGITPLPETERQKMLSPLMAELVDSARTNGYDEMAVQALVTLGVELWLVRDKTTGQMYFIGPAEYRRVFRAEPPRGRPTVVAGGAPDRDQTAIESLEEAGPHEGSESPTAFRSAAPALDPAAAQAVTELLDLKGSVRRRPEFTEAEAGRYELLEYVTDGRTILTLKEAEMKRLGFADPNVTIKNDDELKAYFGATNLRRLNQSWSEDLVEFMTQGLSGLVVRGLLIVVFLMALFIEMSVPGVTLPGVIAILALAGLVVPPMLIGAATWWSAAMVVLGVALILLEIFIIPGFGLPGIAGLLMLFGGLVGTFADAGELFPGAGSGRGTDLAWAMSIVLLSIFVAGAGMYLFSRYTNKFPIAGRLVLASRASADDDASDSLLMAMSPASGVKGAPVSVGAVGTATTTLRPSGTAEFGDKLVDVVSEFGFIEAGQRVRVTSVTEYRVGVEAVRGEGGGASGAAAGKQA